MLTKREFLLTCAVLAVSIVGIWELDKSIPVVAAPPVSSSVAVCDPSNSGSCGQINGGSVDALAGTNNGITSIGYNYVWNGTTWDRQRGTANAGLSVAPYGVNMVAQVASSGNVANATATATLPGAVGKTTYATGFSCESGGATAAADVDITLTGALGGTMHFAFDGGALATGNAIPRTFNPALPASAPNTALVISMPALGAGNTNATCNIEGYQL